MLLIRSFVLKPDCTDSIFLRNNPLHVHAREPLVQICNLHLLIADL